VEFSSGCRTARHLTLLMVVCIPALLVLAPEPAAAHGSSGNYVTRVVYVEPAVHGLDVSSASDGSYLAITNGTGKTVIVLGYEREEYLKITQGGVWRNMLSSTTYINDGRSPSDAAQDTDAYTPPDWQPVAAGSSYRYHDHRTDWMGSGRPDVVNQSPGKPHLIKNWTIDLLVGDTPVTVHGTLSWSPSGNSWMYAAIFVPSLAVILGFGVAIARDARRESAVGTGDLRSQAEWPRPPGSDSNADSHESRAR
jgi:hypothetical protein